MKNNITTLYIFKFFKDFLLIAPVIIPFYRANGLSATEILTIQAIFSASMLVFEIPSGYLSDRWGRKGTLCLGGFSMVAGFLVYSFSVSVPFFILAELLLGFAFSMISGTDSALLYDTLKKSGHTDDYHAIEARAESATRIGSAISSIGGGLLASVSIRLPFLANALSALVLPISALTLSEVPREKAHHKNVLSGIAEAVLYAIQTPHIRRAGLASGAIMTTGIISIWGYFLILEQIAFPLGLYGLMFFFFQSFSALGARLSRIISAKTGKGFEWLLILTISFVLISIALFPSPLTIVLAFLHSFCWGLSSPHFLTIINSKAREDIRATVLSTMSMISRGIYVLCGPLFGMIVDKGGTGRGFFFLAIICGLCFLPTILRAVDKGH